MKKSKTESMKIKMIVATYQGKCLAFVPPNRVPFKIDGIDQATLEESIIKYFGLFGKELNAESLYVFSSMCINHMEAGFKSEFLTIKIRELDHNALRKHNFRVPTK